MSATKRMPRASLPASRLDDPNVLLVPLHKSDADSAASQPASFDLSLIIPTRNEADNIAELWRRIDGALEGFTVECIFVDDSDDATPDRIQQLPTRMGRDVALVHREPGDRDGGLGGAVVRGLKRASAPWVAVMDADLQHPPEVLPELLSRSASGRFDLVIASRYCADGAADGFSSLRARISRASTSVAHMLFPRRLNGVSDPMSGFFLVRAAAIDPDALRPAGFKILLEIMIRSPRLRIDEVPFHFGERHAGESKANLVEGARYVRQLIASRSGSSSARVAKFGLVGVSGLVVNTLALAFNAQVLGMFYLLAAVVATQVSTLWNFELSERFVFRGKASHTRWRRFGMFLGMNNAAFVLRAPMMYTLTSGLHVHYLESNFISLIALMMLRFTTADRWIWGTSRPEAPEAVFTAIGPSVQLQEGA